MVVTSVTLTSPDPGCPSEHLLAYASVVIDDGLVIRDMKLIRRKTDGVAVLDFPSHPIQDRCVRCGKKVDCTANYCGRCGEARTPWPTPDHDADRPPRRSNYLQVVHPINGRCREMIHSAVMAEYVRQRSLQPDANTVEAPSCSAWE